MLEQSSEPLSINRIEYSFNNIPCGAIGSIRAGHNVRTTREILVQVQCEGGRPLLLLFLRKVQLLPAAQFV